MAVLTLAPPREAHPSLGLGLREVGLGQLREVLTLGLGPNPSPTFPKPPPRPDQVAVLSVAEHVLLETPFALTCLVTNTSSKARARLRGRGRAPLPQP